MPYKQESKDNNQNTVRINASQRTQENSPREQINNTNEETQIKLYAYRYVIVVLYCLLNFINGIHWGNFRRMCIKIW